MERGTGEWLPGWLEPVFARGYLGVDIFFVISGFVIAHSVWGADHSPRFLGFFALRRALRLDPPYWFAIALEVALIHVGLVLLPTLGTPTPSASQLFSHIFYAQDLLGQGDVLAVFWTLCYEVQFYIFFVSLLVLWRTLRERLPHSPRRFFANGALVGLFLLSLFVRYAPSMPDIPGLALDRWFQFFLGVLTYWSARGACRLAPLGMAWAAILVFAVSPWAPWEAGLAVYVSAFVLAVAWMGSLDTTLSASWIQYLGSRSYSLYLVHLPIGARSVNVIWLIFSDEVSPALDWIAFAAGLAVSVLAAEVMWRITERPSMAWSKRVRLPGRHPATNAAEGGPVVTALGRA